MSEVSQLGPVEESVQPQDTIKPEIKGNKPEDTEAKPLRNPLDQMLGMLKSREPEYKTYAG